MSKKNNKNNSQDDFLNIQDLLYLVISKWKWFVLSLILTMGIATVYLLRTPKVYTRKALVMVKSDSKGKTMAEFDGFSEFGLVQSNTNISSEMIMMSSPAILSEVVKRLHLETKYYVPGRFHKNVAYGTNLPAEVSLPDLASGESASFTVKTMPDSTVILSDFVRNGDDSFEDRIEGRLCDTVATPLGAVVVTPSLGHRAGTEQTVYVTRSSVGAAIGACGASLTVSIDNDKASVVALSYKDFSPRRAEDILNTLIVAYNENWVKDRNQIAVGTSLFINERLAIIERELGSVDDDISSFKSEHMLTDIQAASSLYLSQSSATTAQLLALNNQLYMTKYVRDYLNNDSNRDQLLPANSGIESSGIESQIAAYNNKLLQRNSIMASSSAANPLVVEMDRALSELRDAIIKSVDNRIITLDAQIQTLQNTERETNTKIASNPGQAKYLLSVERQQKVKESLYLFLLQKREENELSQAFTAYNTRIVSPPGGSMAPTFPVSRNILLMAFAIGLLIPLVIIVMKESMNTKLRGKKDLEDISVPIVGEIPMTVSGKRRLLPEILTGKKKQEENSPEIVVEAGNRDVVNEAFRVLRTNLEFMKVEESKSNVIAVTSFNPGSGKSFLTINMAVSLAIKGKKVLVIDGDLRHGTSSGYAGNRKHGLSEYLSGRIDSHEEIIVESGEVAGLSILPIGTIPPNPSELLFSGRMEALIDAVRGSFDFVFIDCPPVDLVADAQIISQYVDRTVFVVRVGLLERSLLDELEKLYENRKYPNMVIVLNGTDAGKRHGYKYGYRYGYGAEYYYGSNGHKG